MQASTRVVLKKATILAVVLMTGILTAGIENAFAAPVTFQEGTATFSQGWVTVWMRASTDCFHREMAGP